MKRTFRRRGAVLAAALVLLCAVSFADRGGPASFAATGWALLPPAVAIVLAFATKEVYSSLLAGCVVGALLTEGFAPWRSFETLFLPLADKGHRKPLHTAAAPARRRESRFSRNTCPVTSAAPMARGTQGFPSAGASR